MKPLISVIIATHQRAFLLGRAVASVRAQNRSDVQLLIVSDDTDCASLQAAQALLGEHDLFVCRRGPAGPGASRNLGLDLAQGRFVMFLDDDDSFAPGYFEALAPLLSANPGEILYSDPTFIDEERMAASTVTLKVTPLPLGEITADQIRIRNYIPNNCLIYPQAALDGVRFDNDLILFEDWEFLIHALRDRGLKHIPIFGPQIYKNDRSKGERRGARNDDKLLPTLLAIYKMWPGATPEIKQERLAYLAAAGVELSLDSV